MTTREAADRLFPNEMPLPAPVHPSSIVAVRNGRPGCPETRWDLYAYRCGMGVTECHLHGPFDTRRAVDPS